MISPSKFSGLKKITKYFQIAQELKKLRDEFLLSGSSDTGILRKFRHYLESDTDAQYITELDDIIQETDKRTKLEKIHFLYLKIKDDFGYPVSETEFVKSSGDSDSERLPRTELVVILENLRSAFNAGSIIRSCECFGVKEVILCGMTPGPENLKTLKTAKGTESNVKITRSSSIELSIAELKENGYRIAGAETGNGSTDIRDYNHRTKTAIIFGNEEIGLTQRTVSLCDDIVSIEMRGRKNSLNVASAAAIFLFEFT
jgi:tRNA G18 (ribose-2'-O)-methylase SpoU